MIRTCARHGCTNPLPPGATCRRRFCSDTCRVASNKSGRQCCRGSVVEVVSIGHFSDPRQRPTNAVADALKIVRSMAGALRLVAEHGAPALASAAGALAEDIDQAVDRHFPEVA